MGFLASRTLRVLLILGVLLAAGSAIAGFWFWNAFLQDLPELRSLADYRPPLTSVVLDRKGREIGEFYEYRRRITPLAAVPKHVIQAFLAAEDDAFFEHRGIDFVSILRAAWVNFRAGGEVQGASTITQQMVKQLLLTPERTYTRKIREMVLAQRIERRFSKEEILFLYLNQIYFGAGAYGVGEAARTYFAKDVGALDVGEAALLAGLPKAPTRFSPFGHPEEGERRRLWVLQRMREEGFIDDAALAKHRENPPVLRDPSRSPYAIASYFTEEVRRRLVEELGNATVLHGGLTIETTLDLDLQQAAVSAVRAGVEAVDHRRGYRGPVRRVPADQLEAEIARLADENGLSRRPERLTDGEHHGVLVAVADESADVAFAPGVLAKLPLEGASWAHPPARGHGSRIAKLGQALAVGDVARFRVTRDAETGSLAAELVQAPEVQSALLSFELGSGDVRALVGGYDFDASEFDRATQAQRQPGSAFKPFVYAAAIGAGYGPGSIVYDTPVVVDDGNGRLFRPENYGRRFLGPIPLQEALARSLNNASVNLMMNVGVDRVIERARALGVRSPIERVLSLALGVSPVTLLELTRGYATLGANGRRVEPRFVVRVTDRDGKVLRASLLLDPAAPAPPPTEPVIPPPEAYLTTTVMRAVIEHPNGTGHKAASLGVPLAGKTGTTNDHTDAWFVAFTPEIATGVWVGIDAKQVLGPGETGGRAALPIWMDYMKVALAGRGAPDFEIPPGIVMARVGDAFQPTIEGRGTRPSTESFSAFGDSETSDDVAPSSLDF